MTDTVSTRLIGSFVFGRSVRLVWRQRMNRGRDRILVTSEGATPPPTSWVTRGVSDARAVEIVRRGHEEA